MHAEGSVQIEIGRTRLICTASVEERVPPFLRGTGRGWVTAEYGMLPRATTTRMTREATAGKVGGDFIFDLLFVVNLIYFLSVKKINRFFVVSHPKINGF